MKKSRYTEEQIAFALRQAEGGTPVADVCRQMGVSEASFYVWKKKYGKLGLTEIRELRQLRDENARLTRLVADLTLDKHILGEVIARKLGSQPCVVCWRAGSRSAFRWRRCGHAGWCDSHAPASTANAWPRISRRCGYASGRSRMRDRVSDTNAFTSCCDGRAGR
jgi:putative transposase